MCDAGAYVLVTWLCNNYIAHKPQQRGVQMRILKQELVKLSPNLQFKALRKPLPERQPESQHAPGDVPFQSSF